MVDKKKPQVLIVHKAIILYKLRLLIIKRSGSDGYNAGKWEFPGGRLEEGQDVSDLLEDEVFRETGLMINDGNRMAYYATEKGSKGVFKGMPVIRFVSVAKVSTDVVKLSKEHSEFKWVGLSDAVKEDLAPWARKALQVLDKEVKDHFWKG